MSYREENGQVILTMSPEDYSRLLVALEFALADPFTRLSTNELLNRLNQGNPHYTPYQVGSSEKSH